MKIVAPTKCPCCSFKLELVKDQLFCRNPSCGVVNTKKVEAFAKVMKIKGLGPKTVEKLGLTKVPDIYLLEEEHIVSIIGDALGKKLYSSIEFSREVELGTFFSALSIPLFGKSAASKLAPLVTGFDDVSREVCKKAGLGDKVTDSLLTWIDEVWKDMNYNSIMNELSIVKAEKSIPVENRGAVVITGKLNDYKNRKLAATFLESKGFTIKSSVTKAVDYLVSEEGRDSSSVLKAKKLNIPILSIIELLNIESK